jgi:hypothetical protein
LYLLAHHFHREHTVKLNLRSEVAMRKMVIHFGPDMEGGGTSKHDFRDTDPAEKRYTEQPEPAHEAKMSWLGLLPREFADKIRRWERLIDNATMGMDLLKKFKKMPQKRKILIGAVAVAGVAGAAYLATRRRK